MCIRDSLKAAGKTVLVAEHRLWYAADLADRVFYLREGQLEQIYTCLLYTSRCV